MVRAKYFPIIICIIACGCKQKAITSEHLQDNKTLIQYAEGFTIAEYANYTEVTVRNPLDKSQVYKKYHLYKQQQTPDTTDAVPDIMIPVSSIACLSTTHVGFLEALQLETKLIACSGTKYLYNEQVRQMITSGKVKEIGEAGGLNVELLITLQPDIVMSYSTGNSVYDQTEDLGKLHINKVLNNEFLETSPLGQTEWIKFVAVFFDALPLAEKIFDSIAYEYHSVQSIVQDISNKPLVFSGMAFKGEWTVPGGKSFAANYLRDAGATYVWEHDEHTGSFPVALEEVIAKAKQANYWMNPGAADNLEEITNSDARYQVFDAFKKNMIYNNNRRVNEHGGNDYWESGIVSPQIILKDLIHIFYPGVLNNHTLVYYKHLE
jgi:iron complex transport system substrate-binding protein